MKYYINIFLILFLFGFTQSKANIKPKNNTIIQYNAKKDIERFFLNIYSYDFEAAKKIMNAYKNKSDFYYNFFQSNFKWWQILNGNNSDRDFIECSQYIENFLDAYGKLQNKNLQQESLILSIYTLKMRLNNYHNHNKINSLTSLYKILNLSKKVSSQINDPYEKAFNDGVYNYFVSYAKEESIIATVLLFTYKNTDKNEGIEKIEFATQSKNDVTQTEALYLLYKIYAFLEKDYQKALLKIKKLTLKYPKNIFYKAEYYNTLILNENTEKAIKIKQQLLIEIKNESVLTEKQKEHYLKLIQEKTN